MNKPVFDVLLHKKGIHHGKNCCIPVLSLTKKKLYKPNLCFVTCRVIRLNIDRLQFKIDALLILGLGYIYRPFQKICRLFFFFLQNHWTDFNQTLNVYSYTPKESFETL